VQEVADDTEPLAVELRIPPAGGEIAAVVNTDNLRQVQPRQVVFFRKGGLPPRFVPVLSCQYEPLQYPLLFPHGTPGWGLHTDGSKNFPCSQIDWYRHLFLSEPRFQIFGRLACEYAVDMFSRTEDERLNFVKRGRRAQRIAPDDAAEPSVPESFENKIPASFMGSAAWASDQVADALAIARDRGTPSFWLTPTTNPNWPEIRSRLRPGQDASDCPAVVCRAFHARLHMLKTFIRKQFGGLTYEISVVEFQKRGLPHAHIVVKLLQDPPLSAIDDFISAELPDPLENPTLYNLVRRFHMHSPDHLTRSESRCNQNDRCIYGYPQPITPHTYVDDFGRFHYRRRKNEDLWVTPYIPALLQLLECHIYVDLCSSALIFLYLFKYLFKGPDRTRFSLRRGFAENDAVDEYDDYMNGVIYPQPREYIVPATSISSSSIPLFVASPSI
jgi:hypothetical protein